MSSGIYCIENLVNGKKYIGYSNNISKRWREHKTQLRGHYHENTYLLNAWKKYGETNFNFWIIEEYPIYEEKLRLMEIYFVAYYNSFFLDGNGYNLSRGGEGIFGHKHSDETKIKIGLKHRGKIVSEETRKKLSEFNTGKHYSEEVKKKMSESRKGENNPMFGMSGEKSPNFGKVMPEETKKKLSNAKKGIGKGNKNFLGKHHSEETKKKLSDIQKGRIISEETKKKISMFQKGKVLSEETKKKMGDAKKEYWRKKHEENQEIINPST
jgi:group I intron endonuclease